MKYAFLSVFLLIVSAVTANAQVAAMFTRNTHNGVSGVYFEAQNTLAMAYPISFKCVKARNGAFFTNTIVVQPGAYMWMGPDQGWVWEDGDVMIIMYPNGNTRTWTYNE